MEITIDDIKKFRATLSNETVWLTADQMAEQFQRDRTTIQRHIKIIYEEGVVPCRPGTKQRWPTESQ